MQTLLQEGQINDDDLDTLLSDFKSKVANIQNNRNIAGKAIKIDRYFDKIKELEFIVRLKKELDLTKAEDEKQKEYWIKLNKEKAENVSRVGVTNKALAISIMNTLSAKQSIAQLKEKYNNMYWLDT